MFEKHIREKIAEVQAAGFERDEFFRSENFYCSEGTALIHAALGDYLETDGKLNSEFGFRFRVKNLNAPHLCMIRYPDDKKRYMGISDCFSYDLSTGVSTGGVSAVEHGSTG